MIELIGKLIISPFVIVGYFFKFIGYFLYAVIMFFAWCIQGIINFIIFLFSLFSKKGSSRYVHFNLRVPSNNISNKKKKYQEKSGFDKEADLWGLSKEDRIIAKEERMSPAEYVEAEERDNDELDTDD